MNRNIWRAVLAAALTGLLQIDARSPLHGANVPANTIYMIAAFSLICGALMAYGLLTIRPGNEPFLYKYVFKYIDAYTYFLAGTIGCGLFIFIQNRGVGWQSGDLLNGYFFGATGIGLMIGGVVVRAMKQHNGLTDRE